MYTTYQLPDAVTNPPPSKVHAQAHPAFHPWQVGVSSACHVQHAPSHKQTDVASRGDLIAHIAAQARRHRNTQAHAHSHTHRHTGHTGTTQTQELAARWETRFTHERGVREPHHRTFGAIAVPALWLWRHRSSCFGNGNSAVSKSPCPPLTMHRFCYLAMVLYCVLVHCDTCFFR